VESLSGRVINLGSRFAQWVTEYVVKQINWRKLVVGV